MTLQSSYANWTTFGIFITETAEDDAIFITIRIWSRDIKVVHSFSRFRTVNGNSNVLPRRRHILAIGRYLFTTQHWNLELRYQVASQSPSHEVAVEYESHAVTKNGTRVGLVRAPSPSTTSLVDRSIMLFWNEKLAYFKPKNTIPK